MATKAERDHIDGVFRKLDTENTGRLSKEELRVGFFELYGKAITDEELEVMF